LFQTSFAGPACAEEVLLFLHISNIDDLWDFVDEWETKGARFPHVYPPDAVAGDVPPALESAILEDPRVFEMHRRPVVRPPEKDGGRRAILLDSWREGLRAEDLPVFPEARTEFRSLVVPPFAPGKHSPPFPDIGSKVYGQAFGANFIQTSEWMLGRVAVGVILPDCPGHTYSASEIASVVEAVRAAMGFWASNVKVLPGVRFVYEIHHGIPTAKDFAAAPPRIDEEVWIPEILGSLGYRLRIEGTTAGPVYEMIDSLRTKLRAEWGICMIIPKVPSFRAAYTSYSHFGGPLLVAPAGIKKESGRLVAGTVWLPHLLMHETGHLFWALDESCESGFCSPCHVGSGYLHVKNANSTNHDYWCDRHVDCCMDIPGPFVCRYTLGQMGIQDIDEDLIPDVLDTHPYVALDSLPDTVDTIAPLLTGLAAEIPMVNREIYSGSGKEEVSATVFPRNNVTFNSIEHVIYQIDGIVGENGQDLWLYADPPGGWERDTTFQRFAFRPDSLTGGDQTITIRAVNTMGNRSTWGEQRLRVFVKAIALHDFAAYPDYDGNVRISFRVRGGTFGATAALYRTDAGGVETLARTFPLRPNAPESLVDSLSTPGAIVRYRLEISALGKSWNYETEIISPAPLARGTFLSRVTPNPFRDRTVITYRIPRGEPTHRPYDGGKPNPATNPPPTGDLAPQRAEAAGGRYKIVRAEIDIFNLAGRRVRSFPHIHSYEGIYADPVVWDGRDDAGRRLPAGFYFIRLRANDVWESRKVLLLD